MTHFNGTMKNCNGFSTPTKAPTSRQGVATSCREGTFVRKAVREKDPLWPRFAQRTLEISGSSRDSVNAARMILERRVLDSDVDACRGPHYLSDMLWSVDACFLKWAVASESACGFPW